MNKHQKYQIIQTYHDWLESKQDNNEWTLFAFTVVFKPVDATNSQSRWEDEYKTRVLNKFRRALERNTINWTNAVPLENLFYFERFEHSKLRITGTKAPFHIHSLIPIPTPQVHRVFSSDDNRIKKSLEKDLLSIDVVQNVLLEKMKSGHSDDWLTYISKGKEI